MFSPSLFFFTPFFPPSQVIGRVFSRHFRAGKATLAAAATTAAAAAVPVAAPAAGQGGFTSSSSSSSVPSAASSSLSNAFVARARDLPGGGTATVSLVKHPASAKARKGGDGKVKAKPQVMFGGKGPPEWARPQHPPQPQAPVPTFRPANTLVGNYGGLGPHSRSAVFPGKVPRKAAAAAAVSISQQVR